MSAGAVAINPDSPPGAASLAALRDQVKDHEVSCIFFEPQFDGRAVHALSRDLGLGFSVLDPIGPLAPPGVGQYRVMLMDMVEGFANCSKAEG